jgi:hypothetical protein
MVEPHKRRKNPPRSPAPPRQMAMAFESSPLRGLNDPERMKVLMHLASLLMLAAGVAAGEDDDEP